jgi:Domain of unknown function (DUF4926)
MPCFELYSRVRLLGDSLLGNGVTDGAVGFVLEDYSDGFYEVEFVDVDGLTVALLVVCRAFGEGVEGCSSSLC